MVMNAPTPASCTQESSWIVQIQQVAIAAVLSASVLASLADPWLAPCFVSQLPHCYRELPASAVMQGTATDLVCHCPHRLLLAFAPADIWHGTTTGALCQAEAGSAVNTPRCHLDARVVPSQVPAAGSMTVRAAWRSPHILAVLTLQCCRQQKAGCSKAASPHASLLLSHSHAGRAALLGLERTL